MSEDKEDSRNTNKWIIILTILILAFLGFYFYNQYGYLLLEPKQESLEVSNNQQDIDQTKENSNNSVDHEESEASINGDNNKTNGTSSNQDSQVTDSDLSKEETENGVMDLEDNNQNSEEKITEKSSDEKTDVNQKNNGDTNNVIEQNDQEDSTQVTSTQDINNNEQIRDSNGNLAREIDLLIIGQDKKENVEEGKVQSDSIILANLKPNRKILSLTAVPSHKEYQGHKLQYYNKDQLMNIMYEITGINPDYYFVIDYEGFKNIVNLISGVEVNINKEFEVPELGLYLKEGNNLLSGQEALNYARYYDPNENELTRIKRQKQVMQGFANKIFQKNTLLDIPRLYKTIVQTIRNVKTNFDYDLAIESYNFIRNSSDFKINYDVLEIYDK